MDAVKRNEMARFILRRVLMAADEDNEFKDDIMDELRIPKSDSGYDLLEEIFREIRKVTERL